LPFELVTSHKAFNLGVVGLSGVLLFFVLSGYLITSLLLRSRAQDWRIALTNFYVRRTLRIFPIYYLTLLFLAWLQSVPVSQFIYWHVAYLSNILFVLNPWAAADSAHFWTLSVEEQFYLVWPLFVLLVPYRHLLRVILWAIVAGICWKAFVVQTFGDHLAGALPTVSCLDALGIGAALAFIEQDEKLSRQRNAFLQAALIVGGVLVLLQVLLTVMGQGRGLVLVTAYAGPSLVFVWLVGSAARGFKGVLGFCLEWKVLLYVGKISYGIYLYHNFMPRLVRYFASVVGVGELSVLTTFVCATTVTLLTAAGSWHFIEKPISQIKERFTFAAMRRQ
jgi:peptidoglycan/LPS O-acetylase OafA/YrhL